MPNKQISVLSLIYSTQCEISDSAMYIGVYLLLVLSPLALDARVDWWYFGDRVSK